MRLGQLFKLELAKQKRSLIWAVVILLPLGINGMMFFYMIFRDYNKFLNMVASEGIGLWQAIILENHYALGWSRFMPIVVAVLSTLVYYPEYRDDSWKNLLSQPLTKNKILLAKFIIITFYTGLTVGLNAGGLILVGKLIGFTEPVNFLLYMKYVLYQIAALIGVISIHNWLGSYFKNILIPVAFSLGAMIISGIVFNLSTGAGKYLPYFYHYFIGGFSTGGYEGLSTYTGLVEGIIFGIMIYLFTCLEFKRRNIS